MSHFSCVYPVQAYCDGMLVQIKDMLARTLIGWWFYTRTAGRHGSIENFLKRAHEFHIR